jgi:hypothetical protein
MGFYLRRQDDAICHWPVFGAEAFDQQPNTHPHGDETDNNEQEAKELRAATGNFSHGKSLIARARPRP